MFSINMEQIHMIDEFHSSLKIAGLISAFLDVLAKLKVVNLIDALRIEKHFYIIAADAQRRCFGQ